MTLANQIRELLKEAGNARYVYVKADNWVNPLRITAVRRSGKLVQVRTMSGWMTLADHYKIYAQ